jgi:transmembrane sensor
MLTQKEKEIVERYIDGLADKREKEYVESLFLSGEDNPSLRYEVEKDWFNIPGDVSISGKDLSQLLDHIHHIIKLTEFQKRKNFLTKISRIYMKVAAILLFPLLFAGLLFYFFRGNQFWKAIDQQISTEIFAPMGSRVSFSLPDGTKGMLNSGSRLGYTLPFKYNRKVQLEGEAWFEVARDEDHPFEINTGNSMVRVLGTSFNMSAYPSENYVEVVLQQGKVEFQNNKGNIKGTIIPSERLVYKTGTSAIRSPTRQNTVHGQEVCWFSGEIL